MITCAPRRQYLGDGRRYRWVAALPISLDDFRIVRDGLREMATQYPLTRWNVPYRLMTPPLSCRADGKEQARQRRNGAGDITGGGDPRARVMNDTVAY